VRAIDTNVLVRALTREQSEQGARAAEVLAAGNIFIATTVLLETEWVLRSAYGFPAPEIAASFRKLAGLENVTLEDDALTAQALNWTESGMDFADALHLGRSQGCSAFVSFDRKLAKLARPLCDVPVAAP
jgi:predicted nucleic-acid-binding protein